MAKLHTCRGARLARATFGTLSILAAFSAAGAPLQVIWDKYDGANTFWGSAITGRGSAYGERYQDIVAGLANTDEVRAMAVDTVGSLMTVSVYTAFLNRHNGPTSTWPRLGDLFISTDGWNPYRTGAAGSDSQNHATADNNTLGEDWELVISTPDVGYRDTNYSSGTFVKTTDVYGESGGPMTFTFAGAIPDRGGWHRPAEEVYYDKLSLSGIDVGDATFSARHATAAEITAYDLYTLSNERKWSVYSYSFDWQALGLEPGSDIALRWAANCANDIIEGRARVVPEPSGLALVLVALLAGAAPLKRRRSS